MMRYGWRRAVAGLVMAAAAGGGVAQAGRWVPAWGSSQMLASGADADRIAGLGPVTIRQIVHLSGGGRLVRVRLSNVAGDQPLRIGAARLATGAAPGQATVAASHPLTFAGAAAVVIPAGAEVYSDPLAVPTRAGDDVAISLFLPEPVAHRTGHPGARATTFAAAGDRSDAATLTAPVRIGGWWSLADVEVDGGTTATIVAIGDSITDGRGVRDDANTRWTDVFARRLAANPATRRLSVVNAGIGGNRILLDGSGPNLLARFDRDVIARPGVTHAIVLEGVNDLGTLTRDRPVDAAAHRALVAAITGAYRQLAARAHAHGIRLIGGTITPLVGNDYYHAGPETEADRQAINTFIRSSGTFDAVVDFDRAVRDPAHPDRLLPAYDTGDHLHPNEAGYRAMAAAVPLAPFAGRIAPRRIIGATAPVPVAPSRASAPRIALTFDDIPAHGPLPANGDRLTIARTIIAALRAAHAPAFGFYNGIFSGDPQSAAVVAAWRGAGFPLGNHSWSHGNLDAVTAPAYLADIARDTPVLATAAGQDWRWFRYPFLSEGTDPARREAVRAGLRAEGYRVAAVTMSFGDYGWNDAYARCVARRDDRAIAGLEASFLAAARAQALRSRALAQQALGRDIPYVLLLHLGAFDARMMPRLLALYRAMGFAFTTLPQAEADPFYAAAVDLARPGPSPTLEAAAAARGIAVPANAALPDARLCAG